MIIKAKFAGICPCCKEDIAVGSDVEWKKGEKARHPGCAAVPAGSGILEPVSSAGQPAIRAQHWSQHGHGPAVRICAGGCGRRVGPRYAECYSCHQESLRDM